MNNNMVRKDKHLVLAKQNWNELEGKLFATLIKELNPKYESDFKVMEITIDELEKLWGTDNVHTTRIRETCYDLQTKAYEIPLYNESNNLEAYHYCSLFHTIRYEYNKSYIKFQFHDDMKPFLIDFANQFVNYDISNVISFKSKYTLSFYEYFKLQTQFKKEVLITEVISVEDLRIWLNLNKNRDNKTDKYTRLSDLKKRILDPVKEDMLTSDVNMDYSVVKKGRSPSHIKFTFTKSGKIKNENALFTDDELKSEFDEYIGKKFKKNGTVYQIMVITKIKDLDNLTVKVRNEDKKEVEFKATKKDLDALLGIQSLEDEIRSAIDISFYPDNVRDFYIERLLEFIDYCTKNNKRYPNWEVSFDRHIKGYMKNLKNNDNRI